MPGRSSGHEGAARHAGQEGPGRQGGRQPVAIICYLCGRKYGSQSFGIHEPQCLAKWRAENAQLPAQQRRRTPQRPEILRTYDPATLSPEELESRMEAMADAAYRSFQDSLVPCPMCGRRFAPDRLQVHLRACKPK